MLSYEESNSLENANSQQADGHIENFNWEQFCSCFSNSLNAEKPKKAYLDLCLEYKMDPISEYELVFFSHDRNGQILIKTKVPLEFLYIHILFDKKIKALDKILNSVQKGLGKFLFSHAKISCLNVETCLEEDELVFLPTLFGSIEIERRPGRSGENFEAILKYSEVAEKIIDFLSAGTYAMRQFLWKLRCESSCSVPLPYFVCNDFVDFITERYNWKITDPKKEHVYFFTEGSHFQLY